jgi:hypothetical protein
MHNLQIGCLHWEFLPLKKWCAALLLKNFKLQKVARINFKDKIAGVLGPSPEKYVVCVDAF